MAEPLAGMDFPWNIHRTYLHGQQVTYHVKQINSNNKQIGVEFVAQCELRISCAAVEFDGERSSVGFCI